MPQLSCEQCRKRKTKCDKSSPCSACKSASISCTTVQRDRLPRGKSGKARTASSRDAVLEEKVDRIERLLKQVVGSATRIDATDGAQFQTASHVKLPTPTRNETAGVSGNVVASDFWTALSSEVAGIRDTIESLENDDDLPPALHLKTPSSDGSLAGSSLLFGQPMPLDTGQLRVSLSSDKRNVLLDTYEERVDSVLKVGHYPTMRSGILSRYEINGRYQTSSSKEALEQAIYFTAVCTMSPEECSNSFASEKDALYHVYRSATESMLQCARLLQQPDLDGLRAMIIYLQGIRISGAYATSWTLFTLAVRIANALGLDQKSPASIPLFELECRRRLWYSICLADTQATLDRGSIPLIPASAVGPPPLNVNDNDMSAMSMPKGSMSGWTDMSAFLMAAEAMVCQKQICEISSYNPLTDKWAGWQRKLSIVAGLEDSWRIKYMSVDLATATSLQLLTKMSAESIATTFHLLLRRPPYRQQQQSVPPWDDYDILGGATLVLEWSIIKGGDQRLASWMWKKWPPWYALAVVLAELCKGDASVHGARGDRAYAAAVEMYKLFAAPVDDPESGVLWRPITKLLQKVTHLRKSLAPAVASGPSTDPSLSTPSDGMPSDYNAEAAKPDLADVFMLDGLEDISFLDDLPELDPENGVSWLSWDLLLQDAGDPSPYYAQYRP